MKFLIVQLGRIGDMILATPMLRVIRDNYPDAGIDVVAGIQNHAILRNNPYVRKVYIHDKSPLKLIRNIIDIRGEQYDILIDPKDHSSTESGMIARIVRAGIKVGYNSAGKVIFSRGIPGSEANEELHYVSRCMNALKIAGLDVPIEIPRPELFPGMDSVPYVDDFLGETNTDKFITLNLSASNPGKLWENGKWERTLKESALRDWKIVVSFAPSEKALAEDLKRRCPGLILFRSRSIEDVMALISRTALLITPDTSLVHIAAAFDKPIFALFSSLEDFYKKFYPLSSRKIVIRSQQGDGGIKSISAEDVIESVEKAIDMIEVNDEKELGAI
jgi:ADP-heptose:LPS heptosyltransferase